MANAYYLLAAVVSAWLAMAWLALSLDVHWQQVYGKGSVLATARQTRLRLAGAAGLALALWLCLQADHPSMAVLTWPMLLALAAWSVAMQLASKPRLLRWVMPLS